MRNSMIAVATLITFTVGFAQNKNAEEIKIEKQVLHDSKRNGDAMVTTTSLYRLIALEGENSTYRDSLAYVYFAARKYAPCFMVASDVLKRDPKHLGMLEMKAISLESLGALDKALETNQELFTLTKNNFNGYTVAKLEYSLKKNEEAFATIQKTEKLNDAGTYKVTFNINQQHTQQVELLAAIAYLKGLIAKELDKNDIAKASYEKALKIQPDFVLAKDNLENLQK
jgi:tetratricopeptide (TPR) repeat protein